MQEVNNKREQNILDNLPLVQFTLARFFKKYDEDMVQTGYLALIEALDNYKPTDHGSFSSYAVKFIRGRIIASLQNTGLFKPYRKTVNNTQVSIMPNWSYINDSLLELGIAKDHTNDSLYKIMLSDFYLKLSDKDKIIFNKLVRGYRQTDIANAMHVSKQYISKRIETIRDKYLKMFSKAA